MASQNNNNRNDQAGNFAGLLIALIAVGVFILIVSSTSGLDLNLFAATEAAVVPTETPTPLPPTDTPVPPTATPTPLPPTDTPPPTEAPQQPAAEASGAAYDPELIAAGEQLYITCAGCHGFDAHGVPNLGKELVGTEFMRTHTDDELLQFIITGRPLWDPDNTTGMDMPSRGGNPALSNDDILAIIAYLRSLDTGDE